MDPEYVERHYSAANVEQSILEALRAMGKDIDALRPADLAPVDEFHIRGREATEELAALAGVQPHWRVLDVGSGLGGSARYLAETSGCHVTGIDLTAEYCRVATRLSERVGLAGQTEFRQGSALDMPFEDASFDLVWTEHAQMNIADKARLYSEIARVLRPGGTFVFHDVFQGDDGEPHFPVPWASSPSTSVLMAVDRVRSCLEAVGLAVEHWDDRSQLSRDWFRATAERMEKEKRSPLGLHLLMGEDAGTKLANVVRNLEEGRIVVYRARLRKPG